MTAQAQLEQYLDEFRQRLKNVILARGAAALAGAALLLTVGAVYIGIRRAFAAELMVGARIVLVVVLGVVAAYLLVYPLRALRRDRGVRDIEQRAPDFDGRVETYQGLADAPRPSPFLGLLAEDTLGLARRMPAALRVPQWEFSLPGALAVLAAALLLGLGAFGPDNWRYGVRHLWAGWALGDALPPQRIAVTPGDGAVRRGGDLAIEALAEGFDPVAAEVFALFEGSDAWESAPMQAMDEEGFDFVFYAVREPLRYYVVAAGVRSPEYAIDVVDLPRVRNIKLTYHYPNWTGLEQQVEDPGGDIHAVEGTDVQVQITTDRPLGESELLVNADVLSMQTQGNVASATLEVSEDGEYYVSTFFNEEPVRLTEDYFISVIPDNKPVVKLIKPGRDWRASNIEEVTVRVEASDDFGLDTLELHYSVNGGEVQVQPLEANGDYVLAQQILYLEEIAKLAPAESFAGRRSRFPFSGPGINAIDVFRRGAEESSEQADPPEAAAEEAAPTRLQPGDLISYFVQAKDRDQSVRTELFFVEVQPFDRSFSQSMQGGGGGGGGGQQQDEISQRQKEILVATWNLIREREEDSSFLDEQQFEDNATMLSGLQLTLAEQARTLASRTRARQLTSVDDQIQTFVENLERAAEAMIPAADRLADLELEDAVPSEQAALQHLLRAESVFTDIQVAFNQGGGGGGGFAGRDLSELFELEMDLEKNQYETETPFSLEGDTQQPEVDEAIAKLQELARRQEELARQANNRQGLTEEERWQQDMLRRETEELKRQLEELQRQLQQQQAANQQQSDQQSGQQSGQQQSGQPSGQLSASRQGAQEGSQTEMTAEAIRELERALQAMDRATGENLANADPQQARRAIEQARRQLDRALEQMTEQRAQAVAAAFSDLADRSEALFEEQREIAAALQRAMRDALEQQQGRPGSTRSTLTRQESYELAEQKFAMQQELEALEQDIQSVAQQFRGETPGASEELNETLTELQQSQAIAILGAAAERIRRGAAADVAATMEPITTAALRELERGTEEALALATREAVQGSEPELDPNAELVAELQALRRDLAELTAGNRAPGGAGQPGQRGQEGQPGEPGQPGSQQGGQEAGGAVYGGGDPNGVRGGYRGPSGGPYRGIEDWTTPLRGLQWDPQTMAELENRLQDAGRELLTLGTRLRSEGLTAEELEAVRRLGDALRGGLRGNPELVEQEYQNMLTLVEQLELELRAGESALGDSGVRTEAPVQVAQGYEEAVAEYFRRLSRAEP